MYCIDLQFIATKFSEKQRISRLIMKAVLIAISLLSLEPSLTSPGKLCRLLIASLAVYSCGTRLTHGQAPIDAFRYGIETSVWLIKAISTLCTMLQSQSDRSIWWHHPAHIKIPWWWTLFTWYRLLLMSEDSCRSFNLHRGTSTLTQVMENSEQQRYLFSLAYYLDMLSAPKRASLAQMWRWTWK